MAGGMNKLTDRGIQVALKAAIGPRKLSDGSGLYLAVMGQGRGKWRLKYRLGGVEKVYTIGPYPAVGLAQARRERDEARALVLAGRDPVAERRAARLAPSQAMTFAAAAEAWLEFRRPGWRPVHYTVTSQALRRDVFPVIGALPLDLVRPPMVAEVVKRILARGVHDTASKILQNIGRIYRWARAQGWCQTDPSDGVRELLPAKPRAGRMPALLDPAALRGVLLAAESANLSPAIRMAHRLLAFTAVRIGNIIEARWSEVDLDSGVWTIPRSQMKSRHGYNDHKVVLCPQIRAELAAWKRATVGIQRPGGDYLFPSPTGSTKTITRDGIEKAYRETLGLRDRHSPHGWRSSFSTLAREHGFSRDVVELALDHIHDTEVVRAYDRGERMAERVRLMLWWGELLTAP